MAQEDVDTIRGLPAIAPPEVAVDVQTVAAGTEAIVLALDEAGFDIGSLSDGSVNPEEFTVVLELATTYGFDEQAFNAAYGNLQTWVATNCP